MNKFCNFFNDLNNLSDINMTYDKITKFVMDPTIIKIANAFLFRLYRYLNISSYLSYNIIIKQLSTKEFLSCFCIYICPNYILDRSKIDLDNKIIIDIKQDIYDLSKELINNLKLLTLNKSNETLRLFIKSIIKYSNCFFTFINHDKIEKIIDLTNEIVLTELTLEEIKNSNIYDEVQKKKIIFTIEKQKNDFIKLIKTIDKNVTNDSLDFYIKLGKSIQTNITNIFWENLEKDIQNNNAFSTISLIQDIINEINIISKNKKTDEIKKVIDIDYLKYLASIQMFTDDIFLNITEFLILQLIELTSKIKSTKMMSEYKKIINTNNNRIKICTDIFKYIFTEIDDIKKQMLAFYLFH